MTKPLTLDDLARAADASLQDEDWLVLDSAIENAVRAILTTIKEAGWAIVPVIPLSAMVERTEQGFLNGRIPETSNELICAVWQAMLSASPQIDGE